MSACAAGMSGTFPYTVTAVDIKSNATVSAPFTVTAIDPQGNQSDRPFTIQVTASPFTKNQTITGNWSDISASGVSTE